MELIKIKNINSKVIPPHSKELVSRLGFLVNVARRVPCYLVDPDLMDLIYPPQKRVVMDEEKIREELREYKDIDDINEIPIERILETSKKEVVPVDKERRKKLEVMIGVGVYMHTDINGKTTSAISKINGSFIVKFPAIFISPERVYEWADDINISPEVLFAKVLYHELGHVYIHNPHKKGDIYKVIEESFCNAVAFSRFSSSEEIEMVIKGINNQPFEYRGYTYFIDKPGLPFYFPHPIEIFDLLHHLYKRGYLNYFMFSNDVFRVLQLIWKSDKNFPGVDKFYKYLAYHIIREILGE